LLGCGESTKDLPEIAPALVAATVDAQDFGQNGIEAGDDGDRAAGKNLRDDSALIHMG
jgi:hypothetical protein